jgi:Domain of unknown function (DUF4372)/Transposase DDE domain
LTGKILNKGKTLFTQVLDLVPRYEFNKCVSKYNEQDKARTFSFWDQFIAMLFAQLTHRESLRDIERCLNAIGTKAYHLGLRSKVTRSTLAYANDNRDWRIWQDFAYILIAQAQKNLSHDNLKDLNINNAVYALDATVIDLCLTLFPWAQFRTTKAGIKMHTLLDLSCNIPDFIAITEAKVHEVNILDSMLFLPGAFYVMDRGYLDFERLYRIFLVGAFFVIRAKHNTKLTRLYSHEKYPETGVRSDQTVKLSGYYSSLDYPANLRRISFYDQENDRVLIFLTNNFSLPAETIAKLYKARWQIELFFKWIKQHLRIKTFFGTSENSVKTQIWIAVSAYVLVALTKNNLKLPCSTHDLLQILSVAIFEKKPLNQAFSDLSRNSQPQPTSNQLDLFGFPIGQ